MQLHRTEVAPVSTRSHRPLEPSRSDSQLTQVLEHSPSVTFGSTLHAATLKCVCDWSGS